MLDFGYVDQVKNAFPDKFYPFIHLYIQFIQLM